MVTHFAVDIEADGPTPGLYSMISVGAVVIEQGLNRTFYQEIRPISKNFKPEALAVGGFTREETLKFEPVESSILKFANWVVSNSKKSRPVFIGDNVAFDFSFVNYYLHKYYKSNPFGHSARNVKDLYKGLEGNIRVDPAKLRKTPHTHNALDDAMGIAEIFLQLAPELKIEL